MKSRTFSFDWMILASAGILFVFGKFIAPSYEKMLKGMGEITPISTYCLIGSVILILVLIGRWIYRWKNRKSER